MDRYVGYPECRSWGKLEWASPHRDERETEAIGLMVSPRTRGSMRVMPRRTDLPCATPRWVGRRYCDRSENRQMVESRERGGGQQASCVGGRTRTMRSDLYIKRRGRSVVAQHGSLLVPATHCGAFPRPSCISTCSSHAHSGPL